jgi:hypothetical protein
MRLQAANHLLALPSNVPRESMRENSFQEGRETMLSLGERAPTRSSSASIATKTRLPILWPGRTRFNWRA